MSFAAFSKDFNANMFTAVENQFITKYLPWADGDAVRVYLYGLYLCASREELDAESAAALLKLDLAKLCEIFRFWEECGLVHILAFEPLVLEYLPVSASIGKPKPIRPEKYTAFNRELLRRLQKIGKDFKPYEMQKILEFLENERMEPQAFLLIVEYCIKKDGENLRFSHLMNKAKQLVLKNKFTYDQVERDLADFNLHEKELSKIFTLLGIDRKPRENDYELLDKWLQAGMENGAVIECAASLTKGTLATVDNLIEELLEKGYRSTADAKEYLARRKELVGIVFAVAQKLGVKVQNPRAYAEEYADKWTEHGYDGESLTLLASLCFKLGYGFADMDALINTLYLEGIVDKTGIKEYCAAKDKQFKLLQSVQTACGVVKKTQNALDMVAVWQSWNFSDEMIIEAARRSAGATAPLSYMNKLLSEWKRTNVFTADAIPEKSTESSNATARSTLKSEAAIAADRRAERDHYYAVLRQNAIAGAEHAKAKAERDPEFHLAESEIKKFEIELAKAEVFAPDSIAKIQEKLIGSRSRRSAALQRLGLDEKDLEPQFKCKKCSDTGFLPNGRACNCYKG